MEASRFHLLLSELHKLASSYTAEEFADASNFSSDCRNVLVSLSTLSLMQRGDGLEVSHESKPRAEQGAEMLAGDLTNQTLPALSSDYPKSPEDIADILRRSGRAETTLDLERIIKDFGLDLSIVSKAGKVRNLSKVAKAISSAPQKTRNYILRNLLKGSKSETQGWLDVIRSAR